MRKLPQVLSNPFYSKCLYMDIELYLDIELGTRVEKIIEIKIITKM